MTTPPLGLSPHPTSPHTPGGRFVDSVRPGSCSTVESGWCHPGRRHHSNSRRRPNVDLMLGQRLRRWPSIKSALVGCLLGLHGGTPVLPNTHATSIFDCQADGVASAPGGPRAARSILMSSASPRTSLPVLLSQVES